MRPLPRTPSPQLSEWIPGNLARASTRQNIGSASSYHVFPVNSDHPRSGTNVGSLTETTEGSESFFPTFPDYSEYDFPADLSSDEEDLHHTDAFRRRSFSNGFSNLAQRPLDPIHSSSSTPVSEPHIAETFQEAASLDDTYRNTSERVAIPVYVLHCASCETFLTDRGMKAVLLLKHDITLYSTDAFPANCSAAVVTKPQTNSPDAFYTGFGTSYSSGASQVGPYRTCDCLTQELSCHGCGTNVAYHIVSPCQRCMRCVQQDRKNTNGHRYVFHQREVLPTERRYTPGEPGIIAPHCTFMAPDSNRGESSARGVSLRGTRQDVLMEDQDTKDYINTSTRGRDESDTTPTTQEPEAPHPGLGSNLLWSSSAESLGPSRNTGSLTGRRWLNRGDIVHWNELKYSGELPPMVAHAYGDKPWQWHVMKDGRGCFADGER